VRPALLLSSLLLLSSCKQNPEPVLGSAADLWSGRAVWRFELTLDEAAMESLTRDKRKVVPATFKHGATVLADVGVRFKGHRAMQGWKGKPAFKVKFDETLKERRFLGLRSLTLNNLVEDPTMVREALAYRVYREAGAPAPRTAYAELYVNGKPYGLYLVVESVDESFLEERFGEQHGGAEGHLYEGEYGCDLHPEDVSGFDVDEGDEADRADLAALAGAARQDPARVYRELVDEKAVLGYLAAAAWLGDFDGYRHSHNYRIYLPPGGGRAVLIPWGLDRTFKKRLSIYDSDGVLARLCFGDPACRVKYVRTLQDLTDTIERAQLQREADALVSLIAAAERRDPRKKAGADETRQAREALRAFLAERPAEIRGQTACLAGEKEVDADGDGAACMDCQPANAAVHPGAAEACNGIDDDCSGVIDDAPACACQSRVIEGVEFFLCDRPMSWADAAAFCQAQGHVLARIDSKKQSKALFKEARKLEKDRWWIGLSDRDTEGQFRWADGAPLGFARWAKGQPDNDGCHEDCVALKDGTKGKWHDTHCAQRRPFVCAAKTTPPASSGAPAVQADEADEAENADEDETPPTDTGAD
jgi:hypothetical protein